MSKYYNVIFSIILVATLVWTSINYYKLIELKSRTTRVEKIQRKGIKSPVEPINESLLLSLQEKDTTLILTCVGVGFALFAFLTFKGTHDLFKFEVLKIQQEYDKAKNDYESQHMRLLKLENDINFQYSITLNKEYEKALKSDSFETSAVFKFLEIETISKILSNPECEKDGYIQTCKRRVSVGLSSILELLDNNNITQIRSTIVNNGTIKSRTEIITKVVKDKDFSNLNKLVGMFVAEEDNDSLSA